MKKHTFSPVIPNVNFPQQEEEILSYWKKEHIFEESVESRPKDKTWTFLDGPPFITGLPHYGTLLSSIPKDLFPRYVTMKGYRVRRVWGWDCHGLPAENKVEQQLHIKRKKDIEEKVGVKTFIDACKTYVKDVSGEWEWYVDHIARWVDFTNAYKTMDLPYMESVMWVFKQMYDKNYIYKGMRVSLYCPHCVTPISNFEVAMDADNYKEVTESGTTYKYQLKEQNDTFILAWSTTPWNKIVTPALAVNPNLTYVKVKQGSEFYILAESTKSILGDQPYTVVETMKGRDLVGTSFVPHYDFYPIDTDKKAFVIIPGDFVTAEEGTGVVTIAAYGEDDLAVMQKENIQIVLHVDEEGMLKPMVPKWAGMYYLDVNPLVNEDLAKRGLIYKDEPHVHTVPTCWRCHTRLIFAPQNAWYVDIQKLKKRLKETNEHVHWYPEHFKYGRYLKSLESAPDWCISRSRYWGSPVPVWECACGKRFVPGSIAELEKRSSTKITDLHKPVIDDITITCESCGKKTKRVPEVLDSWIEAGSAPFGERHYPFDKTVNLADFFPPAFIVEYTGQIRAWFYVLHVIATAIFDTFAFKNVVVTGVILGTDGRKMSKNFGNYPDPKEMIQKYGGDALRLYLLGSSVMHGEDILISEEQYKMQVRGNLLILWNVYNFFITYAIDQQIDPASLLIAKPAHVLDRWILSRLHSTLAEATAALDIYDSVAVVKAIQSFIEELSTWYLRRSRKRMAATNEDVTDKTACFSVLYQTLLTLSQLVAPVIPFVSEAMYRNLTGAKSVHLTDWPKTNEELRDVSLENDMAYARRVVEKIHAKRKELKFPVRQPLPEVIVEIDRKMLPKELLAVIEDEVNIRRVTLKTTGKEIVVEEMNGPTPELLLEGKARELSRAIQGLRKDAQCDRNAKISVTVPREYQNLPESMLNDVQKQTLVERVVWGETLGILT